MQFKFEQYEDEHSIIAIVNDKEIGKLTLVEETVDFFIEDLYFIKEVVDNEEDKLSLIDLEYEANEFDMLISIRDFNIIENFRYQGYGRKLFEQALIYISNTFEEKNFIHLNASPTFGTSLGKLLEFYQKNDFKIYLDQGGNALMYKIN